MDEDLLGAVIQPIHSIHKKAEEVEAEQDVDVVKSTIQDHIKDKVSMRTGIPGKNRREITNVYKELGKK
ncbi:hypothetical protein NDU88_006383 [Pleurodeles waltl]|uniref:Uncharacterized protein n=1 Tax=Pleurodeles waltl TaxID=8319 RepID=A0AAV7N140_PLEWA|nr:hypothetical protein NDU88_006383 [Pleurodeles waltl]